MGVYLCLNQNFHQIEKDIASSYDEYGSFDKIVEKSASAEDNFRQKERNTNTNYRDDDDDKYKSQGYNKNRKKSFLGDLFDF